MRTIIRRVCAAGASGAMLLGLGVGLAAPASAGTGCASGWLCLFSETNNAHERENWWQFGEYSYGTDDKWLTQNSQGTWVEVWPADYVNEDVEAVNYQWQIDNVTFYWDYYYAQGTKITDYEVGEWGFRNWSAGNCNIASSHKLW